MSTSKLSNYDRYEDELIWFRRIQEKKIVSIHSLAADKIGYRLWREA